MLDGNKSSHITPAFDKDIAHKFFTEVYHAVPRNYVQPAWMPTPNFPEVEMDCSPITPEEMVNVIKKTKHSSAPSPFDRVGYTIFKKCPALIPALLDLFNACWSQAFIPAQWKTAAVKLIAKGSAADGPGNPGNFHPITVHQRNFHYSFAESLADVHDSEWVPGFLSSEGLHAYSPRLY